MFLKRFRATRTRTTNPTTRAPGCVPRSRSKNLPLGQEVTRTFRVHPLCYLRHSFPSFASRPLFHSGIITVQFPSSSSMGEDCTLRGLPGPLPLSRLFFSFFFLSPSNLLLFLSNLLAYSSEDLRGIYSFLFIFRSLSVFRIKLEECNLVINWVWIRLEYNGIGILWEIIYRFLAFRLFRGNESSCVCIIERVFCYNREKSRKGNTRE